MQTLIRTFLGLTHNSSCIRPGKRTYLTHFWPTQLKVKTATKCLLVLMLLAVLSFLLTAPTQTHAQEDRMNSAGRYEGPCGIGPGFEPAAIDIQNNSIMQQSTGASELSTSANHELLKGTHVLCPGRAAANQTDSSAEGRGLWLSFHLGHNFPLGSFRKTFNSGPSITADLEYEFRRNLSLYGMVGYHYFNDKNNIGPDLTYTNLSLNLRGYFPVSTWRGFVQAGPGFYHPNFGPNKFGFNVGTGLDFPIHPKLAIELGTDLHVVDPGGRSRVFVDPKLGIKFRF